MSELWGADELADSVEAYFDMQRRIRAGEKVNKTECYRKLDNVHHRTVKAEERRFRNISYVLQCMGRDWIPGVSPQSHVGPGPAAEIERAIAAAEGREYEGIAQFEIAVAKAAEKQWKSPPVGNESPEQTGGSATRFKRDPEVIGYVLHAAAGVCECCQRPAPFKRGNGKPFLETHHVRGLADGGSDRVSNAVAICPNCHEELHHGAKREHRIEHLYRSLERLVRESS